MEPLSFCIDPEPDFFLCQSHFLFFLFVCHYHYIALFHSVKFIGILFGKDPTKLKKYIFAFFVKKKSNDSFVFSRLHKNFVEILKESVM